jgi:hypothetical protein
MVLLDDIKITVYLFPTKFTDCRLIRLVQKLHPLENLPENETHSLVKQRRGKPDKSLKKRCQTKSYIRGGDYGDYIYGNHYDIKHTGRLHQQLTNPGHPPN